VAVAPALLERGDTMPWSSLAMLVAGVVGTGLVAALAALRLATAVPVVEALKSE
jgi:hypothetical protein